ncbi:MAG: type III-B CRISPR module RAMP protein Cmr1, partial [Candidatus Aenigmarchaeota archaeon]|nr:type III-B CRISPR module RAMP protein Cmr1 [Candidatus Aenigmarchaeota archaeon]
MEKVMFNCEVVTPMFLAGADGKTPELRPPSIKGALRFWWRATNGHLPIDKLKEKEAKIFGGSGDNEGRSKVIIRVISSTINNDYKIRYPLLPHHPNKVRKPAIKPGFKFTV